MGRDNMMPSVRHKVAGFLALLAVCSVSTIGCNGGAANKPVAKVKGKVTYNGQPVSAGTITFFPVASGKSSEAGLPARGVLNGDGTYELSTYGKGDGAIIGKHRVAYSAPSAETPVAPDGGHAQAPPPSPFEGLGPKVSEVDVTKTADANTIDVELQQIPTNN